MATSFKRSHACTATLSAPNPTAGHCEPTPLPETPGDSWTSLSQSLVGSLLLSPGSWCTQGSVSALQESVSPVLCKFWWLYGGINGDLLHEGLCHTQVYCTQSRRLCSILLLTCTSSGHSICGSNCSVPGRSSFSFVYPPSGTGPDLITSLPFLPTSMSIFFIVLVV